LNWTVTQVLETPIEVVLLCERLGWRGQEGFDRLQNTPEQMVRDWLVIAEIEREKERANS
jgi:hypothetical protein